MASKIQLLKNLESPGEMLYLIQDRLDFHSIARSQVWNVRPEIPSFLTEGGLSSQETWKTEAIA